MRRRVIPFVLSAAMGAMLLADAAGLRFNATASMPVGAWWVREGDSVGRGEIVTLCLPEAPGRLAKARGYVARGVCVGGTEPLIKPVAAIAGDEVTVSPSGVAVNGQPIANTAQLPRDEAGRPLQGVPAGSYLVAPNEVWVLSGHNAKSFDSRYFGPVPLSSVTAIASPVWVRR